MLAPQIYSSTARKIQFQVCFYHSNESSTSLLDRISSFLAFKADKVIAWFEDNAQDYTKIVDQCKYMEVVKFSAKILKETLKNEGFSDKVETLQFLDIGCGSGFATTSVAFDNEIKGDFDGMDPCGGLLQQAADKNIYRKLEKAKVDENPIPFGSSAYDVVLCFGAIAKGYIKVCDFLREITRVLKPGGIAVYTISYSLDRGKAMAEHAPYISEGQLDLLKIEQTFYQQNEGKGVNGHVYVVKKN